jgi:hypothetical protein
LDGNVKKLEHSLSQLYMASSDIYLCHPLCTVWNKCNLEVFPLYNKVPKELHEQITYLYGTFYENTL